MKKILICIITLILFYTQKVFAEEIWSEIPKEGIAKTEIRYRWYQEELIPNGYINFLENDNIVIDKSDYKYEYGAWKTYNGENLPNIEKRTIYNYKKLSPIRYIHIYDAKNLDLDDMDFYIDEIKVYLNNEEISYDKKCFACEQITLDNINDKTTENKFKMYTYNGYIMLDLVKYYEIRDLSIEIIMSKQGSFKIAFSKRNAHRTMLSANKEFIINDNETNSIIYQADETWNLDFSYSSNYTSEEEVVENFDVRITPIEQYREVNTLYHSYIKTKKYYDNNYYITSPEPNLNLIKDENDYKVFYNYNNVINEPEPKIITKTNTIYKDSEPKIIYKTIKNDVITKKENNKEIKENTTFNSLINKEIKTIKINKVNKYCFIFLIIVFILSIIQFIIIRKRIFKK